MPAQMKEKGFEHVAWRESRAVVARLDPLKLLQDFSVRCDTGKTNSAGVLSSQK